jgi:hypothetical protein
MTGQEKISQNYDHEITGHHIASAALEHDPFIDDIPTSKINVNEILSAAEVPHLKELAEKAVPALPKDENITKNGLHKAITSRRRYSRAA